MRNVNLQQISNNLREFNSDLAAKALGLRATYSMKRRQYTVRHSDGTLIVRKYNFETIMEWFETYTSDRAIRLPLAA